MIPGYHFFSTWTERTRYSNYFLCEGTEEHLSDCDSVNDTSLTLRDYVARVNCTKGR